MNLNQIELLSAITQQTVYLMGISFMLGALFTIFVLLILDMLRASRAEGMETEEPHYEAEYEQDAQDQ